MTHAGATKCCAGIVSTALCGRSLPEIQWIGASKCVPVCSPQEKLFQYQPGPRASYCEISSMRKPQHCPISGGSAICGKSGDSVWVRSTIRMPPPRIAPASAVRSCVLLMSSRSRRQLALEHLGIVAPSFEPLLRDVAGVDVLDTVAQRLHDRAGERSGREFRRRQIL